MEYDWFELVTDRSLAYGYFDQAKLVRLGDGYRHRRQRGDAASVPARPSLTGCRCLLVRCCDPARRARDRGSAPVSQLSPELFRSHHHTLGVAPFYGAVSMGILTVGSGALLAGSHVIGTTAAVWIDAVLWTLGTTTGLVCAVGIPYLLFTEHRPAPPTFTAAG